MGYTIEIRNCGNCKYSEEKENPMLDRDWYTVCNYNKIQSFRVNPAGKCNKWETK